MASNSRLATGLSVAPSLSQLRSTRELVSMLRCPRSSALHWTSPGLETGRCDVDWILCMRIVFLDRSTFSASIAFPVARLAAEWQEHARTAPGEVWPHAAEATAVVTNKVKLPAMLLEKLPRLKLVAVAATGVDHVDLDAARRLGIGVCNVRHYSTHSVPEHVFTVLLALRRNLIAYAAAATNGTWSRAENFCLHNWPIEDLAGSTLGLVGGGP